MEFVLANYVNTSTVIGVGNGSLTAANLLIRDGQFQYISDGDNSDLTTTSITLSFGSSKVVSRIAMDEMNWKDFTVFYDGVTANTFSFITSTAAYTQPTSTTDFSSNSETAMYWIVNSQTCSSITFDIQSTQEANNEKAVGWLLASDLLLDFERIPSSKNYTPMTDPREIVHTMSNGKVRIHKLENAFNAKISFQHMSRSWVNSLRTIKESRDDFVFTAFPAATSWDEISFPVVWPGKFDWEKYTSDAQSSGFSGSIDLRETDV